MTHVGFDRLAPHYLWLEHVVAGRRLQACRTAYLATLPRPRRVLVLGVGRGRFVRALVTRHPGVPVVCVDASAAMLARVRRLCAGLGAAAAGVSCVHADALSTLPVGPFDLVATHFFLDCFRPDQLSALVDRVASVAAPGATWLVADFAVPAHGWRRWRARAIHALMYAVFRLVTGLAASRLTPPDEALRAHGFRLRARRTFDQGLLHSDCWELGGSAGG